MPHIDLPASEPAPVQRPAREAAPVKSGRPAWQSPWAAAAVLVLIAITTGVTFLGGKAPAPAATASGSGTLEIGTNPDGVAVFIDGANGARRRSPSACRPARTSSSSSPKPSAARCP